MKSADLPGSMLPVRCSRFIAWAPFSVTTRSACSRLIGSPKQAGSSFHGFCRVTMVSSASHGSIDATGQSVPITAMPPAASTPL
ncbi:hypothetical protein D3C78_1487350 [compost metagenome]